LERSTKLLTGEEVKNAGIENKGTTKEKINEAIR